MFIIEIKLKNWFKKCFGDYWNCRDRLNQEGAGAIAHTQIARHVEPHISNVVHYTAYLSRYKIYLSILILVYLDKNNLKFFDLFIGIK